MVNLLTFERRYDAELTTIHMKKFIQGLLHKAGYTLEKNKNHYADLQDDRFMEAYTLSKSYTMTSLERMYGLYTAVDYILKHNIPGDFVECGVWKGGSAMLMAIMLHQQNIRDRKIYLYDTFEGMSAPTDADQNFQGKTADSLLKENPDKKENIVWCLSEIDEVQNNLRKTGLADEQMVFVKGKVEDTIPNTIPNGPVALLRLDTDWYESTKHELVHLYPRLSVNGVLIIDDYGHWKGCRQAVDEYFRDHKINMLLSRLDYTGRLGIKTNHA